MTQTVRHANSHALLPERRVLRQYFTTFQRITCSQRHLVSFVSAYRWLSRRVHLIRRVHGTGWKLKSPRGALLVRCNHTYAIGAFFLSLFEISHLLIANTLNSYTHGYLLIIIVPGRVFPMFQINNHCTGYPQLMITGWSCELIFSPILTRRAAVSAARKCDFNCQTRSIFCVICYLFIFLSLSLRFDCTWWARSS